MSVTQVEDPAQLYVMVREAIDLPGEHNSVRNLMSDLHALEDDMHDIYGE